MIKKIIIFILSFSLILIFSFILVIISGKNLVNRNNLSNYIKDANILNLDIDILFDLNEDDITLKEKIIKMAIENGIPEKIVYDLMESEEINIFLGDFYSKTINYAVNGGDKPVISQDVIDKMNKVALLSLEDNINIMISKEELEACVLNYSKSLTNLIPEKNELIGNFPLEIVKIFLNFNLNILYIVTLFITFLIYLVSKKLYKIIKYIGLSMIISGVIFVIIGSMDNLISNFVINNFDLLDIFTKPLITNVLTIWFKYGVLVSFIGVFLYIVYVVINRINLNNSNVIQ